MLLSFQATINWICCNSSVGHAPISKSAHDGHIVMTLFSWVHVKSPGHSLCGKVMWRLAFQNYILIYCTRQWLLWSFFFCLCFTLKSWSQRCDVDRVSFSTEKQGKQTWTQVVVVSADSKAFGSRCALHFHLFVAANMSCQRFCKCIWSCFGALCGLPGVSAVSTKEIWVLV